MHVRALIVVGVFLVAGTCAQSRRWLSSEMNCWITQQKVPALWEDAQRRCETDGAVLASPLNLPLFNYMQSLINVKNHSSAYFIGTRAKHSDDGQEVLYVSVEGRRLDEMPSAVFDEIDQLDLEQGDCLSMDRDGIRAVSCLDHLPYICYSNETSECGSALATSQPAPTSVPTTPASVPTTPASVPTTPASVPTTPASVPTTPASVPTTPASVPTTPASVPTTPASVPTTPASVPTTPASVPTTPASVPTTPASVPTTPASVPTTPASVPTTPASVPTTPASGPTTQASVPTTPASVPTTPASVPTTPASVPTTTARSTTTTNSPPRMLTIPSGYTHKSATGSYYKFYNRNDVTWYEANATCASEGAHVVVLNNAEEADIVQAIVRDGLGSDNYHIWTERLQYSQTKGWHTIHGEPLSSGYPRNSEALACTFFYARGKYLVDYPCGGKHSNIHFVCEISQ